MAKALLLILLLSTAQEDPQVTYREGLFEEVDQGNLEKAAELYAKVLKSGASDGLKAKALLRTGFCHEKKGRKKEAEQAWRDVIERFPGAAETVKLARDRLTSIAWDGGSLSTPLENQIQALVLELTNEYNQQNAAVRKLVAIGQPAVPELRKALLSKAQDLRGVAAYVLVQIGAFEGVYEGLKPLWIEDGEIGPWPSYALGETLKAREEDRKQFLKDIKPAVFPTLFGKMFRHLGSISDPAIAKMVEDHLVEGDFAWDVYFQPWTENRDLSEIRRMTKRLQAAKLQPHAKVREMLKSRAPPHARDETKVGDPELKHALLTALSDSSDTVQLMRSISVEGHGHDFQWWMFSYMTPREFVRGPLATWILRGPDELRSKALYMLQRVVGMEKTKGTELAKEIRQFQLDFINTPEHPVELRRRVFVSSTYPDTPELQKKFLQFCLESLKEEGGDPEEEGQRKSAAAYWLMQRLAPDSKEMAEALELAARGGWLHTDLMAERKELRAPALAVALKVLKDPKIPEKSVERLLSVFAHVGTPQDKAMLGSVVALMRSETESEAVRIFHEGITELPEADREAAWKTYVEAFNTSPEPVKAVLAGFVVGNEGAHVMEMMTKAADSTHPFARAAALRHWTEASHIPLKSRTLMLAKGLKDSIEDNQLQALKGLTLFPDLDAVPSIIDSLNSPFAKVRAAARIALDEIKKHYEAQAEWKRWYDETKKALNR
jgi:HEAT repeat protein